MNRTQRAIKKRCHKAMNEKKREKRFALAEMRDGGHGEQVKSLAKDEKGLKKWHRKILNDYTSQNNNLEVAGA